MKFGITNYIIVWISALPQRFLLSPREVKRSSQVGLGIDAEGGTLFEVLVAFHGRTVDAIAYRVRQDQIVLSFTIDVV